MISFRQFLLENDGERLKQALLDNPPDEQTWRIYSDWLEENNEDPTFIKKSLEKQVTSELKTQTGQFKAKRPLNLVDCLTILGLSQWDQQNYSPTSGFYSVQGKITPELAMYYAMQTQPNSDNCQISFKFPPEIFSSPDGTGTLEIIREFINRHNLLRAIMMFDDD